MVVACVINVRANGSGQTPSSTKRDKLKSFFVMSERKVLKTRRHRRIGDPELFKGTSQR
jgi:hypothetical protein